MTQDGWANGGEALGILAEAASQARVTAAEVAATTQR
jgi:hypothetical protein